MHFNRSQLLLIQTAFQIVVDIPPGQLNLEKQSGYGDWGCLGHEIASILSIVTVIIIVPFVFHVKMHFDMTGWLASSAWSKKQTGMFLTNFVLLLD